MEALSSWRRLCGRRVISSTTREKHKRSIKQHCILNLRKAIKYKGIVMLNGAVNVDIPIMASLIQFNFESIKCI